jgi:hypothetical protein
MEGLPRISMIPLLSISIMIAWIPVEQARFTKRIGILGKAALPETLGTLEIGKLRSMQTEVVLGVVAPGLSG